MPCFGQNCQDRNVFVENIVEFTGEENRHTQQLQTFEKWILAKRDATKRISFPKVCRDVQYYNRYIFLSSGWCMALYNNG